MKCWIIAAALTVVSLAATAPLAAQSRSPWDVAPAASALAGGATIDQLETMLRELGHQTETLSVNNVKVFRFSLRHSDGDRTHLMTIDTTQGNVVVLVGGGFSSFPQVNRATPDWYRRVARLNNAMTPRQIFINDSDVLGMTSVRGNVELTKEALQSFIAGHVQAFDEHLIPLAAELVPQAPLAAAPY